MRLRRMQSSMFVIPEYVVGFVLFTFCICLLLVIMTLSYCVMAEYIANKIKDELSKGFDLPYESLPEEEDSEQK